MSKRLAGNFLSGGLLDQCAGHKNDARPKLLIPRAVSNQLNGHFERIQLLPRWMLVRRRITFPNLKMVSLSQEFPLVRLFFRHSPVDEKERKPCCWGGPQCSLNDRHMYITLLNGTGKKKEWGPPAGLDESFRHERLSLPTELRLARHWSTLWWFPFETWETTKMLAIKSERV
jgi:hypothetical protein